MKETDKQLNMEIIKQKPCVIISSEEALSDVNSYVNPLDNGSGGRESP